MNHHNLKEIYDRVNALYFAGKLDLPILWGPKRGALPQRKIRLGSYHLKTGVIRIHRILDQPHVPEYFLAYIVYHEMLHHVLPPIKTSARRNIHHDEFKKREKMFQEYALAKRFSAAFVKTALGSAISRSRRSGMGRWRTWLQQLRLLSE